MRVSGHSGHSGQGEWSPGVMREEGDRDDINDRPVFSVTGDMGGMHTNHQESSQMMSFCYTYTYMRFMI